jgi:hypothetical protein
MAAAVRAQPLVARGLGDGSADLFPACLLALAGLSMWMCQMLSARVSWYHRNENNDGSIRVAFVGNSMMFVNDLPRLMEAMSGFQLAQDSCLHGSLNLGSILRKGNGMYGKFVESIPGTPIGNDVVTDFGACTVAQLLLGHDPNLQPGNANGYYVNDGTNPCLVNQSYYDQRKNSTVTHTSAPWDFVVMNDRSIYPAVPSLRNRSISSLRDSYAQYFLGTGATPVLYVTYAYPEQAVGDIPTFTSLVWEGYTQYAAVLAEFLPSSQRPILSPVGIAFLLLWEENYGLWERLFGDDKIHPSPHGTYLIACVLYATLQGRMPPATAAIPDNVKALWDRARCMQLDRESDAMPFPTQAEANFLYLAAKRVVLQGERPRCALNWSTAAMFH